jgi:hypothetical protein
LLPEAAELAMLPASAATADKAPIIDASSSRVGFGPTSGRRTFTSTPLLDLPVAKAFLQQRGSEFKASVDRHVGSRTPFGGHLPGSY